MIVRMKKEVTEEEFLMETFGCTEGMEEFDIEYMKNNDLKAIDLEFESNRNLVYRRLEDLNFKYEVEARGINEFEDIKCMFAFNEKSFSKLFEIIKEQDKL